MSAATVANWLAYLLSAGATVAPVLAINGQVPSGANWTSQQVNTRNGPITVLMPSPVNIGAQVDGIDSGLFCSTNAATWKDPNGYKIQDPVSGALLSQYVMSVNGQTVSWRLVQDPTEGIIWAALSNDVAGGGGGGGGGGSRADFTLLGTRSTNGTLSRPSATIAWVIQPIDTSGGPVAISAWVSTSVAAGDTIELPDAGDAYGTNAVTFNGNGLQVEDPYNQSAAPASSWSSPPGFNRIKPAWMAIPNKLGTLVWRAMRSS